MCHECNMGMGNDGIDASNSLDTCIQLNNSGIHDMNDKESTDDMQNGNTMGNTSGVGEIESTAPGTPPNCADDVSNSGGIKSGTSRSKEDLNTQILPQLDSETSNTIEVSQHQNEKIEDSSNSVYTTEVAPNDNGNENGNRDALPNASQQEGSGVISHVGGLEMEPRPDPSPVPVYRNESLLRVSHMKRHWGGKRVTDVRTVSELLEIFYSLEEPIITPLPRHHNYYDQWARNPRCDVIQRLYPRANSTGSPKCWTLFQIIQNDQQGKAIVTNPSPAPNPQRLAPRPTADANCESLESIIDHYNHMMHCPPPDVIPTTPPLPHRSAPSQNRTNSGSSRSSSCSSSRGNTGNHGNHGSHATAGLRTLASTKAKSSPVPLRKLGNISHSKESSYNNNNNGDSKSIVDTPKSDKRCRKNSPQDYEAIFTSSADQNISNYSEKSHPKTPRHPTSPLPSNLLNLKVTEILVEDKEGVSDAESEVKSPARFRGTMSARETRHELVTHQPEKNRVEDSAEDTNDKTGERNPLGINPNTLSLSLPYETYERAHTVAEIHTQHTNSSGNKTKLSSHNQEDNIVYHQGSRKAKSPDRHERFPLRSSAFVSRGRRANTTLDFVQNKTRLKNLTRTISKSSPHHQSVQNLKDSLVIHELSCDLGDAGDHRKWDYPFKSRRSGHGSKSQQQSLLPKSRPVVAQLPDRMHSMLEEHLAPKTPPGDSLLSPEVPTTPYRGNSAASVSLASVHFLDLADLRNLLKKSKTTLSYL